MTNNTLISKPLELSNKLKQVLIKYRESLLVTDVLLIEDSIRLLNEVGISQAGDKHKEKESKVVMNVLTMLIGNTDLKGIVNNL